MPNFPININIDNLARPASLPREQDGQMNPQLNPIQFAEEFRQQLSSDRGVIRHVYMKPHSKWMDNQPFPKGFKILDVVIFTSEDAQSTIKHNGRFIAKRGRQEQMNS